MSEIPGGLESEFQGFEFMGIRIPQELIDAAEASRPALYVPPMENIDTATADRVARQISGLSRSERQSRFRAVQELRDGSGTQVES